MGYCRVLHSGAACKWLRWREAYQKTHQREQAVAGRETEDVDGKVEDEKVAPARRKTKACYSRKIKWFFFGGKVVQLSVTWLAANLFSLLPNRPFHAWVLSFSYEQRIWMGPKQCTILRKPTIVNPFILFMIKLFISLVKFSEFNCVEYDHSVDVDKVELVCITHVKGRLKERLAFWQSIGASRWVLEVLKEGIVYLLCCCRRKRSLGVIIVLLKMRNLLVKRCRSYLALVLLLK